MATKTYMGSSAFFSRENRKKSKLVVGETAIWARCWRNRMVMNLEYAEAIAMTVSQVPYGKVATYGQIARMSGLPGYARYVSRVLGKYSREWNLPWHRVIRSDGKIALRAPGLQTQTQLLRDEKIDVVNGSVNLKKFQWNGDE